MDIHIIKKQFELRNLGTCVMDAFELLVIAGCAILTALVCYLAFEPISVENLKEPVVSEVEYGR